MDMILCNCPSIIYNESRGWILLILAIIGGIITLITYLNSIKQRRIENTYKTLNFLRRHIRKKQINSFINLFQANNELSGVQFNEFRFPNGRMDTIETMFSEGGCGNGDIHNMVELLNLITPTLDKLELSIIWYEYGQIMSTIFKWTGYLENKSIINKNEWIFNSFMRQNQKRLGKMAMKYYTYAET